MEIKDGLYVWTDIGFPNVKVASRGEDSWGCWEYPDFELDEGPDCDVEAKFIATGDWDRAGAKIGLFSGVDDTDCL